VTLLNARLAPPAGSQAAATGTRGARSTGGQEVGDLLARGAAADRFLRSGDARALLTPALPTPGPTRVPTLLRYPQPLLGPPPAASSDGAGAAAAAALAALVDGRAAEGAPVWRSADGRLPVELQFTAGEFGRSGPVPAYAGAVLFAHGAAAPPETWARDVEVWASPTAELNDARRAGSWTLRQTTEPQVFSFTRRRVHMVWLRILTNHGSPEYTSLAEFALLPAG
jgi:hypothetical protein